MKTSLFKSPQEFGVHILWLFSSSDDRADCCCVHCSMVPTGRATPSVHDTPSLPGGQLAASQPALAPVSSAPIPQATTVPAPIPGLGQSLLYRTGELVWFTNGPSWRLGLIAQSANGMHQVVPLGHSYFRQPLVGKNDGELRPFQAFTVPPVSIPAFKGCTYDVVGWETVLKNLSPEQAKVHRDSVLLDASKLAAQKIDMCYSLFGKLSQKGSDSFYQGVFLGAERIEVGDTLRVIPPTWLTTEGTIYFGLYEIKSKQSEDSPGRAVSFGGMFYELLEGEKAKTTSLPDNALPRALREESIWRKSVAPTQPLSWSSPGGSTSLEESQIKGRFYPTFLLAPILDPKKFASVTTKDDKERLTPAQVTPALNGRLPMTGNAENDGWRLNRMVAAGASIPHDAVFWFEPQVREEVEAL
ncbi:hypothetical protein IMZ48_48505 [Candidatus Bathyarchaeota archaeon]|nr:hypothetical protein [Candidatus Bathyarchaeota archaeon]